MPEVPDPLVLGDAGGAPKESAVMVRSEESEPALVFPIAMIFVMLGALLLAWGGAWIYYANDQPASSRGAYRVSAGLLAMGTAMIAIGLGMGRMALRTRSEARKARSAGEGRPAVPEA